MPEVRAVTPADSQEPSQELSESLQVPVSAPERVSEQVQVPEPMSAPDLQV
jgi:hypothetical protein